MAISEALERWALASWWLGHLEASMVTSFLPGVSAIRIETGQPGEVALVFRRSPAGQVAYGYAGAARFETAFRHAAIEMARNEFVLGYAKVRGEVPQALTAFEWRCQYFASADGHERFLQRVFSRRTAPPASWSVLFDGEIPGPWSRFATVWRVVPSMPDGYDDEKEPFFAW